jgi:hypothetical protein
LEDINVVTAKTWVLGLNKEALAAFRLSKIALILRQTSRPKAQKKFGAIASTRLSNLYG